MKVFREHLNLSHGKSNFVKVLELFIEESGSLKIQRRGDILCLGTEIPCDIFIFRKSEAFFYAISFSSRNSEDGNSFGNRWRRFILFQFAFFQCGLLCPTGSRCAKM